MRINVNLASQPYEDARRFYLQWLPLLIVLGVIAGTLGYYAVRNFRDSRSVDSQVSEQRNKIEDLTAEKKKAQETLGLPENSGTRDQARFLNELFYKKQFSWTAVLSDLEKMMPAHVQVVSIKPDLTPEGRIELTLTVSTPQRESAIELVRRLEASSHFEAPQLREEALRKEESQDRLRVDIVALYNPSGKGEAAGGQP